MSNRFCMIYAYALCTCYWSRRHLGFRLGGVKRVPSRGHFAMPLKRNSADYLGHGFCGCNFGMRYIRFAVIERYLL